MRYRQLKHRVTIQQPTLTPDGMGGGTHSWSDVATVWANVTTTSTVGSLNAESEISNQFRTLQHFVVILRYRGGIGTNMRLLYKGRMLGILSVQSMNERNWEMKLYCREGG